MENKGEVIINPSPKMPHRDEERKPHRKRRDITASCIIYWTLATMFYINLLIQVIGYTTDRLPFSPLVLGFGVILAGIFTLLGILETRKLKR